MGACSPLWLVFQRRQQQKLQVGIFSPPFWRRGSGKNKHLLYLSHYFFLVPPLSLLIKKGGGIKLQKAMPSAAGSMCVYYVPIVSINM
jgi:hypothetical protein